MSRSCLWIVLACFGVLRLPAILLAAQPHDAPARAERAVEVQALEHRVVALEKEVEQLKRQIQDLQRAPQKAATGAPGGRSSFWASRYGAREKVPSETEIKVFQLTSGSASQYIEMARELLPAISENRLRVVADFRTNTVWANGSKQDMAVLETLIQRLDSQKVPENPWLDMGKPSVENPAQPGASPF